MVFLMGRLFGRWENLSALADEKSEKHAIWFAFPYSQRLAMCMDTE